MNHAALRTKVDGRILGILGAVSFVTLGFGLLVWLKQPAAWQIMVAIAAVLSVFWAGALSVRFSFDENAIDYRSLFRQVHLFTCDVATVEISSARNQHAPQGVPRFHLVLRDGQKHPLNVKVLPLKAVREMCGFFRARGVPVHVQDSYAARRMASQIFGDAPLA